MSIPKCKFKAAHFYGQLTQVMAAPGDWIQILPAPSSGQSQVTIPNDMRQGWLGRGRFKAIILASTAALPNNVGTFLVRQNGMQSTTAALWVNNLLGLSAGAPEGEILFNCPLERADIAFRIPLTLTALYVLDWSLDVEYLPAKDYKVFA